MKIFNTLSRTKEEFIPLEEGKVKMYVCGPTVYNFIHIGNARPMIVFDTVRRYFEYKGYDVNYVSNFTDVDDKIIKKAIEEGVDADTISKRYIEECKKDMAMMNVKPATTHPLATEEICGMLDMIQDLIDKGHAYTGKDGTVYFRTKSFKEYGKLSHKNLEDLQSGFREIKVTGEEDKEDPTDFVLWKPKKDGEPYWESPWCNGRPGWHIECSVMSKKYLGDSIDIHAGGEDLVFPHHENEIAQSEASNGKTFAKYWMHNAFLNIDNRKMSKSLGNFFTVREISEKYDLQVLRFFMLSAHYRSPLNFSAELMEASKNGLERILTAVEKLNDALKAAEGELTESEKENITSAKEFVQKFEASMDDDFNTADAISAVFELVKFSNTTASENSSKAYLSWLKETIEKLCDVLGIITEKKEEILDSEIEDMIAQRQQARKDKNFALADEIRGKLLEMGIVLEDTISIPMVCVSMETCLNCFKEAMKLKEVEAREYSPLALAYLGDAVYELAIRTFVMNHGNTQVNKMHKKTAGLVKAEAQANFYKVLEEELTEEEKAVYRRGRNAKSVTMAKHATMKDYRMATGFEALMGYLYLTEQMERMAELLGHGLKKLGELEEDAQECIGAGENT